MLYAYTTVAKSLNPGYEFEKREQQIFRTVSSYGSGKTFNISLHATSNIRTQTCEASSEIITRCINVASLLHPIKQRTYRIEIWSTSKRIGKKCLIWWMKENCMWIQCFRRFEWGTFWYATTEKGNSQKIHAVGLYEFLSIYTKTITLFLYCKQFISVCVGVLHLSKKASLNTQICGKLFS